MGNSYDNPTELRVKSENFLGDWGNAKEHTKHHSTKSARWLLISLLVGLAAFTLFIICGGVGVSSMFFLFKWLLYALLSIAWLAAAIGFIVCVGIQLFYMGATIGCATWLLASYTKIKIKLPFLPRHFLSNYNTHYYLSDVSNALECTNQIIGAYLNLKKLSKKRKVSLEQHKKAISGTVFRVMRVFNKIGKYSKVLSAYDYPTNRGTDNTQRQQHQQDINLIHRWVSEIEKTNITLQNLRRSLIIAQEREEIRQDEIPDTGLLKTWEELEIINEALQEIVDLDDPMKEFDKRLNAA